MFDGKPTTNKNDDHVTEVEGLLYLKTKSWENIQNLVYK
jgi:hypothetical protein